MTEDELAAIDASLAAITPGPWAWEDRTAPGGLTFCGPPSLVAADGRYIINRGCADCQAEYGDGTEADHAFLAAARETIPALRAEVARLRAELAAWDEIREPAYLWAECQHALQYGEMFPDEQDESYSDAYDAEDEIEGALYDAIIAHIPADWTPTAEQAPWRAEYHSQKDVP